MARETKTIQCYPDDEIINKRIKQYEAFGWELINNQRCQEYEGQTFDYEMDGTTTIKHYSTFNKLTFSRDKSAVWYSQVTALEREFDAKESERKRLNSSKPVRPTFTKTAGGVFLTMLSSMTILAGAAMLILTLLIGWGNGYSPVAIGALCFGIFIIIARAVRKKCVMKNYYSDLVSWEKMNEKKLVEIEKECEAIMEKSEGLIN